MAIVLYREVNKETPKDAETKDLDGVVCEVGSFKASDVAGRLGSGWFGWPRANTEEKTEPAVNITIDDLSGIDPKKTTDKKKTKAE